MPRPKLDEGFVKATSDNLPYLDSIMFVEYFATNKNYIGPEMQNVKAARSQRATYGDSAVEFVQVSHNKNNGVCTVKAMLCPETSTRSASYNVTVKVDAEKLLSAECHSCAASSGGCKHAIALAAWVHRRSEDPSPTECECYWKKGTLSSLGTVQKFIKATDVVSTKPATVATYIYEGPNFLEDILTQLSLNDKIDCTLKNQFSTSLHAASMHNLVVQARKQEILNVQDFLMLAQNELNKLTLIDIAMETSAQFEDPLWCELHYGRISASKFYEVSRCSTENGILVDLMLGAKTIPDSAAMQRGRTLEPKICTVVEKTLKQKIQHTGFVMKSEYPCFGASPDGISSDFVIEIKAPTSEKAMSTYLDKNKEPQPKFKMQIMLQMFLCDKLYGYFCVANPQFETNEEVTIVRVELDLPLLKKCMSKCQVFWDKNIYPKLTASVAKIISIPQRTN